jgi:hypothetical protein
MAERSRVKNVLASQEHVALMAKASLAQCCFQLLAMSDCHQRKRPIRPARKTKDQRESSLV